MTADLATPAPTGLGDTLAAGMSGLVTTGLMGPGAFGATAIVGATLALAVRPPAGTRRRLRALVTGPGAGAAARVLAAAQAVLARVERAHRAAGLLVAAVAAAFAGTLAGPVAALVAAGYLGAATVALLRLRSAHRLGRKRAAALDAVATLAADLRAGLAPGSALAAVWPRLSAGIDGPAPPQSMMDDPVSMLRSAPEPARSAVTQRLAAAWQVSADTGAPLAEVLDRLDTDLRARERIRLRAAAQAAGARATAALLAALPIAGLLLGYGIGADPIRILLHTAAGAACATGAMCLQLLGLLWSIRLAGPAPDRPEPHRRPTGRPRRTTRQPSPDDPRRPPIPTLRRGSPKRRLSRLLPQPTDPTLPTATARPPTPARRRPDRVRLVAALAGLAVALLMSGWPGLAAGILVGLFLDRALRRLEPRAVVRDRQRATAELPFAVDLLAASLRSGLPPATAAEAVGAAVGGPLGRRLSQVGRALALGTPAAQAWSDVAALPGAGRLTATVLRGEHSGAALGRALDRLADDLRSTRVSDLEAAAHRSGVLIVLPLGLCFLPAFVLGGLTPVVMSMLGRVLP